MFKRNDELEEMVKKLSQDNEVLKEKQEEQGCIFEKMGKMADLLIDKIVKENQAITESKETWNLKTFHQSFDDQDLPYNSFIVGDIDNGRILTIEEDGVSYQVTLNAGINQLNLKSGVKVKANAEFYVVVWRTQHPMKP